MSDAASTTESGPPTPVGSLIEELLPDPDFANSHSIAIAAPVERVVEASERYRLDQHRLVNLLFRLRRLNPPGPLRASLLHRGFTVLAEKPGSEVVVGIAGRFWALNQTANLISVADARAFKQFAEPGAAKAAACFRFEPLPDGSTRLSTETRVKCVDAAARRRFAAYWALIGPFSGWIRTIVLRGIRRLALQA